MNSNDIDSALRELAATKLPDAPDLYAQVSLTLSERAGISTGLAAFDETIISRHWLATHPLVTAAVFALTILIGVAQTVIPPAPSATQDLRRQAALTLHLDSFLPPAGFRAIATMSQTTQER